MKHLYFFPIFACCSEILALTKDDSQDLASILSHLTQLESEQHSNRNALQKTMDDLEATKTELGETKTLLNTTTSDLQHALTEITSLRKEFVSLGYDDRSSKTAWETYLSNLRSSAFVTRQEKADLMGENLFCHIIPKTDEHYMFGVYGKSLEFPGAALKTMDVSFHVRLSNPVKTTYNLPLNFDDVHHNAGNGYNTTTGRFTAPVSGTYIFSADIEMGGFKQHTYIQIVRSGSSVSSGYGETASDIDDISIPVTAVTLVRQGEQVWVTTTSGVYLVGGEHGYPTYFAGALLHVD